jgi:hypothetical protein
MGELNYASAVCIYTDPTVGSQVEYFMPMIIFMVEHASLEVSDFLCKSIQPHLATKLLVACKAFGERIYTHTQSFHQIVRRLIYTSMKRDWASSTF